MENIEKKNLTHGQIRELSRLMAAFYVEKDNSTLDRLFQIYDRNGNGSISAEELRTIMRAISPEEVNEEDILVMIEEADTNSNGQIDLKNLKRS